MEQEDNAVKAACADIAGQCAAFNIRRTMRTVNAVYADAFAGTGLEQTQFSLLIACRLAEPAPMSLLANALRMDRTTLARNLAPLQREGLVDSTSGKDRRVKIISLTDLGRQKVQDCMPMWLDAHARVEKAFGEQRLKRLISELRELENVTKA